MARFLGRRLAYTYEVVDLGEGRTRMTLRNRGEPAGFNKAGSAGPAIAVGR